MSALHESNLSSLPLIHRGKVRDLYAIDEQHLLIVQTDRLSAFDVILPDLVACWVGKLATKDQRIFSILEQHGAEHRDQN